MNNYKKTLIIITAILILGMTTITSYAYFVASLIGNDSAYDTVITSGEMALMLNDGEQVGLNNAIPGDSVTKEFSVKNTGTVETTYNAYFSELLNQFEDKNDLVYTLTSENGCPNSNETVVPSEVGEQSIFISNCSIKPNQIHNYQLTITFKNDNTNQDDNKGKKFSTKISINEYKEYITKSYLISGSLFNDEMKALANGYGNIENLTTTLSAPRGDVTAKIISMDNSDYDTLMYFDNKTIYIYSEAKQIMLNEYCSYMFSYLENLQTLNLERMNALTAKVMDNLFYNTSASTINFGKSFDTSNVENMSYMFGNTNFNTYDFVNDFDYSSVTNLYKFLADTKQNIDIEIKDKVFPKATDIWYMFASSNFKNIKFSNVSFPVAKKLNYMFKYANAETIDLGDNFNAESVEDVDYMFYNNDNLTSINIGDNFNLSGIKTLTHMFAGCSKLTNISFGNNFMIPNITKIEAMFANLDAIENIDLGDDFDTSNLKRISMIFYDNKNLKTIHLGNKFNISSSCDIYEIISYCPNLEIIYVGPDSNIEQTSAGVLFGYDTTKIVGGAGTTFNSERNTGKYFRIDDPENGKPGYLTLDPKYQ